MIFSQFTQHLQELEQTSSRLDMTEQLARVFRQLETDEIKPACYLMQGELVPRYQSLEFNMSDKLTSRAIARLAAGLDQNDQLPDTNLFQEKDYTQYQNRLEKIFKEKGDLGLAAQKLLTELKAEVPQQEVQLQQVYQALKKIALEEGEGSQERKINLTQQLLSKLDQLSIRYVVRIILGDLRLGFSTMTMLDALSWAQHQDKSDRGRLELAYNKKADVGALAEGYLDCSSQEEIEQFLQRYELEVGTPVVPALCQRLETAEEIVDKMGEVLAEPKYDGLRAQIHINKQSDEKYQVYTRNLDNVTHMFPELEASLEHIDCQQCILDSEAIAYDADSGELLSFQKTITRKRKHGVSDQAERVPIKFYLFDLLLIDGGSLLNQKLVDRKKRLEKTINNNDIIEITEYIQTSDPLELSGFHKQKLAENLEGAVMKRADSKYRGGRKGWRWVKIKEMEGQTGKLSDTLDCVVMGYYRGRGKRAQFGIGAFLVGVLDEGSQLKTIAKIGTGLTDEQFKRIKQMADEAAAGDRPDQYQVDEHLEPDVWTYPEIVVEIAADELTNSPIHTAGRALRFPRLVKFRDDKDWEQATTVKELDQISVS